MSYEQISKMNFAEFQALEQAVNKVKSERDAIRKELREAVLADELLEAILADDYDSEDEPIKNMIVRTKAVSSHKTKKTAPKEYFIPDELWKLVKGYAGIYNYHIRWDKKWTDIASHYCFVKHCPSIKDMTQKTFCKLGKDSPEIVRRMVWKDLKNIRDVKDYNGNIIGNTRELTLKNLESLAPLFHLPAWCVVGVEVMWYRREHANDQTQCCGKVKKITDKNITIDIYKSVHSHYESSSQGECKEYYKCGHIDKQSIFTTDKGFKLKEPNEGWYKWRYA